MQRLRSCRHPDPTIRTAFSHRSFGARRRSSCRSGSPERPGQRGRDEPGAPAFHWPGTSRRPPARVQTLLRRAQGLRASAFPIRRRPTERVCNRSANDHAGHDRFWLVRLRVAVSVFCAGRVGRFVAFFRFANQLVPAVFDGQGVCRLVVVLGDELLDLGPLPLDLPRKWFLATPALSSTAGHRSEGSHLRVACRAGCVRVGVRWGQAEREGG